jgi:hypothetical protein
MKQKIRAFLTLILAISFLVSFTGIRLHMHNCNSCEKTEYYLFSENPHSCCESVKVAKELESQKNSCCNNEVHVSSCDNCCSTEAEYIKAEYHAASAQPLTKIWLPISPAPSIIETACCSACVEEKTASEFYDKPPYILQGKDFIIYSHQLKIC